jgi:hypothetical protein
VGLPTWTCPFRVFQCFGGGETLPVMSFAFSNVLGRVYPPVMSLSHFSTCCGGETLLVTSRSLFSTCWGGETLLIASISYFRRAVVGKPSPSRRVHFIRHAVVGKPSPCRIQFIRHFVVGKSSSFAFLMFQGEKPLPSCCICLFRHLANFFVNY